MPHAQDPLTMGKHMSLLGKLRVFLRRHVVGKVLKYILPEFQLVSEVLYKHGLGKSMYVDMLGCVTAGFCYVPALHSDDGDCTFTILVALGELSGGGEIAFPTLGRVLPV